MISDFSIRHAACIIRQGGILAYPTDTIYGLGCDPYNPDAVARINTIKCRPLNKQFILLAAAISQLEALITISPEQQTLIMQTDKATSWVVNASNSAPSWLTDNNHDITIRISNNPLIRKLCYRLGHGIISTSANISGRRPAKNSLQLHRYFHSSVDKIMATNKKLSGKPSSIIRLNDNAIIRE